MPGLDNDSRLSSLKFCSFDVVTTAPRKHDQRGRALTDFLEGHFKGTKLLRA